jgi:hypothetical protein
MCAANGWEDGAAVVDEIAARFRRARDAHVAAGRTRAVAIFEGMMDWMKRNGTGLKAGL